MGLRALARLALVGGGGGVEVAGCPARPAQARPEPINMAQATGTIRRVNFEAFIGCSPFPATRMIPCGRASESSWLRAFNLILQEALSDSKEPNGGVS